MRMKVLEQRNRAPWLVAEKAQFQKSVLYAQCSNLLFLKFQIGIDISSCIGIIEIFCIIKFELWLGAGSYSLTPANTTSGTDITYNPVSWGGGSGVDTYGNMYAPNIMSFPIALGGNITIGGWMRNLQQWQATQIQPLRAFIAIHLEYSDVFSLVCIWFYILELARFIQCFIS